MSRSDVIIALGANVPGRWGPPGRTLLRALSLLREHPAITLERVSRLWRCAPYGRLRQPPFVNAIALLRCRLAPHELLRLLRSLEDAAGRRRGPAWGPRALDVDIIDFAGRIRRPPGMGHGGNERAWHAWQRRGLTLPHPGAHRRAFVLLPLAEVAPEWRHPVSGRGVSALLARLPPAARAACRPLDGATPSGVRSWMEEWNAPPGGKADS